MLEDEISDEGSGEAVRMDDDGEQLGLRRNFPRVMALRLRRPATD